LGCSAISLSMAISHASIRTEELELIEAAQNVSPAVGYYLAQTDFLSVSKSRRTTLEDRFQNMQYLDDKPIASYLRFLRNGDEERIIEQYHAGKIVVKSSELGKGTTFRITLNKA